MVALKKPDLSIYDCPYYHLVPKDYEANLRFRKEIVKAGYESGELAEELWIMCKRDPLFAINTFFWTYDPRKKDCPVIPFITYPFQDYAICELRLALGDHDLLAEKSRDMGATWIFLFSLTHSFTFEEWQTFLCVSRKEDLVDKVEDPDSLFWKIDFMLETLPKFLRPRIERTKLHFHNLDNDSTIDGSSTTGDVSRGGRRTAIFLDEFASVDDGNAVLKATRDATTCRLFNSTPKGTDNAFYDMTLTDIKKLRFHWSEHPEKAAGMYTTKQDRIDILDRNYRYPEGFDFKRDEDGKLRSPWYDWQCNRCAHPMEIAQELDIDYLGSAFQFFDPAVVDRCLRRDSRTPFHYGSLSFDGESGDVLEFKPAESQQAKKNARLRLWINPDHRGRIPEDKYTIGGDVATGTGSSNSVLTVINNRTLEKVAEVATPWMKPHEFALYAVALCRWFHNAFLIWEANGPGRIFGDTILKLGYLNVFYREMNEKEAFTRASKIPGFWATAESKTSLLGDYRRALEESGIINRSKESLEECLRYVYLPNGTVAHAASTRDEDPTGARDNHGDRVVADALAWKGTKGNTPKTQKPQKDIPKHSVMGRRIAQRNREKMQSFW